MSKTRYRGPAFPTAVYAEFDPDNYNEADGERPFASYNDGPVSDLLPEDGTSKWIATYKLVRVRKLRIQKKVVRAR